MTLKESKSGRGHYHGYVQLTRIVAHPLERYLLQACLGSDRRKELLTWMRWYEGHEMPCVFFEQAIVNKEDLQ